MSAKIACVTAGLVTRDPDRDLNQSDCRYQGFRRSSTQASKRVLNVTAYFIKVGIGGVVGTL